MTTHANDLTVSGINALWRANRLGNALFSGAVHVSPHTRKYVPRTTCWLIWAWLLLWGTGLAGAQTPHPSKVSTTNWSVETLQEKIDLIKNKLKLDEAVKEKLLGYYQQSLDHLNKAATFKAQSASSTSEADLAPIQLKTLKRKIERANASVANLKPQNLNSVPADELAQRLALEQGKREQRNAELRQIDRDLLDLVNRPNKIRQDLLILQQKLDTTRKNFAALHTTPSASLETEAQQVYFATQEHALIAEISALETENATLPARVSVLKARQELLNAEIAFIAARADEIRLALAERRQQEIEEANKALSQLDNELAAKHPVIQLATRENLELSRELSILADKIQQRTLEKEQAEQQHSQLKKDYSSAEKKISLAGISPALGQILREQRRNLPPVKHFQYLSQLLQQETAEVNLAQFSIEEKLKLHQDSNALLQRRMRDGVDESLPSDERLKIQAELRMLLDSQRETLNRLAESYAAYLVLLGELDFTQQQLGLTTQKYAQFLDQRLLWIPSSPPLDVHFLADMLQSLGWLTTPTHWLEIPSALLDDVHHRPLLLPTTVLLALGLFTLRRNARRRLGELSQKVAKVYSDRFVYTLQAFAYTLILVAPLPLLAGVFGELLRADPRHGEFTVAVGQGLVEAAISLSFLQFLYVLVTPNGIAAEHFHWPQSSLKNLRQKISWGRLIIVPTIFLIALTSIPSFNPHADTLGRLSLIVLMLTVGYLLGSLFRLHGGVLEGYFKDHPQNWLTRLRYLWYPLLYLLPLVIIGFAVTGYYASALELEQKFIATIRLLFLLILVQQLVMRWLNLVNRQLALIRARQKREAQLAKTGGDTSEDPILHDHLIDIPKINEQTQKLLTLGVMVTAIVGIGLIWKNILPALAILDQAVLWQHVTIIEGQESLQPITLNNLLLALVYLCIVIIATRNLPGLLEILLLRWLSTDTGARYAINQLARYALVTIGILMMGNELGASWSQVQWLIAALGVGLGFGLQEIFANLVSGIILLFERPIRVGDTVTIGDVSGKVSRIQMRATTIIDWDQKELVVPNKTFITGQLINWTLSDAVTRIVIDFELAYGTDTDLAYHVLMDTIRDTPNVLKDPEPSVLFMGFRESGMLFSVRVYAGELGHRLPLIHALHMRIDKALRAHGITIPFPQRDVHIRTWPEATIATSMGDVDGSKMQKPQINL